MTAYWRVRVKKESEDFSRESWDRAEVGIWYGGWTAKDLENAIRVSPSTEDICESLNNLAAQRALEWDVTAGYVKTAKRFRNITQDDWLVVYLADTQEIGLARVSSELLSDAKHPINADGQLFKYRRITSQKVFRLSRLPDAYRLLPAQGRGNIHQFNQMWEHVNLLAEFDNESDVNAAFRKKPFDELLDLLGASAWESFCLAYLIMKEDFLPTGLSTGRTLPIVDIVGRRKSDGGRILAQCKKDPNPQDIDTNFRQIADGLTARDVAYYFAYGGCSGVVPENIHVIDREGALTWAKSKNGRLFQKLLLANE